MWLVEILEMMKKEEDTAAYAENDVWTFIKDDSKWISRSDLLAYE